MARLDPMKDHVLKQLELFESGNLPEKMDQPISAEPKNAPVNASHRDPNMVPYVSQNCDATGLKSEPGTGSNMGLLIKHKLINKREEENSPAQKIFLKNETVQKAVNDLSAEQKLTRPEITQVLSFFKKNNYPDHRSEKVF